MEPQSSRKHSVLKLVLHVWQVLASTALLLLVAEVVCRAVRGRPILAQPQRSARAKGVEGGAPYTLHPFLQMANPAGPEVDSGPDFAGFRIDPPDAAFDDGRLRIVFLGGSTTNNRFPNHVRAELEPHVGAITVYNLAFDWYSALHSLYQLATYGERIQPDLVVVLHNVNDFCRGFTPPEYSLPQYRDDYSHYAGALGAMWTPSTAEYDGRPAFTAPTRYQSFASGGSGRAGLVDVARRESALLDALMPGRRGTRAERIAAATATGPSAEFQQVHLPDELVLRAFPAFCRYMAALRRDCAELGAPVLFLTMPYTLESKSRAFLRPGGIFTNDGAHHITDEDFARGMDRFNAAVAALDDGRDAHVLDLAPRIADPKLFADEVHLTDAGQRVEAHAIAEFVLTARLLERR